MTETELAALREKADKAINDLIEKQNLACEELTATQLAEVIRQALDCGDIRRCIIHPSRSGEFTQSVIYVPFAREQELETEVTRLKQLLKECGINTAPVADYESSP